MSRENPYSPPKSKIEPEEAAEQLRFRKRQRRPASHKCVLVFFGLYAVGCFTVLAGMDVSPRFLGILLGVCAIPIVSVVGIIGFRLSKFTYFFTSASLLVLLVATIARIQQLLQVAGEGAAADRAGALIAAVFSVVFVILLLWRYTFGRPSRAYYGFSSAPVSPALPKSVPPPGNGRSRSGAEDHLNY